jgi:hypothetical protein
MSLKSFHLFYTHKSTAVKNVPNFNSLTAQIQWTVYALFTVACCLLILLHELGEYTRPVMLVTLTLRLTKSAASLEIFFSET